MTNDDQPGLPARGLFIPFILLAASVLMLLVWQIANVTTQRSGLKATKAQLAEAIQKREPQVAQSIEIRNRLQALSADLFELSKTDERALAIVKKYHIEQALPAAAEAGK